MSMGLLLNELTITVCFHMDLQTSGERQDFPSRLQFCSMKKQVPKLKAHRILLTYCEGKEEGRSKMNCKIFVAHFD